jgi:hypothetical protein
MTTAIGTYASLLRVKERLAPSASLPLDNSQDSLLQSLCDQVNGWIESKTGRILAPIPTISTTVVSGFGVGTNVGVLASGIGVALGDALMFGAVTGIHEHGIVSAIAGNSVTLQANLVASYAAAQPVVRVLLFDGYDALENGRLLPQSGGIVTMASLEVAFYTGGAFNLIPATDWFLRPLLRDREPGWPATELWMTDLPSAGNAAPTFSRGRANIRCGGIVEGWPAVPDEITSLALNLVTTLYRRRGVGGGGDAVQTGSDGARTISLLLDANDWRTINRYSSKEVVLI